MSMRETKHPESGQGTLIPAAIESWKHKHVLDLDDFRREETDLVFEIADGMAEILARDVKKVPSCAARLSQ